MRSVSDDRELRRAEDEHKGNLVSKTTVVPRGSEAEREVQRGTERPTRSRHKPQA